MISQTKLHKIGGSIMVVIPDAYVKHLNIDKNKELTPCSIEDISLSELKLIFD